MGVYNPKMKIPDSCWACPFCTVECFGAYKCFDVKDWGSREERAKDCPLVEVKAPHGRLIDADALFAKLSKEKNDARLGADDSDYMAGKEVAYAWSMDYTRNAPTVLELEKKDDG